MYAAAYQRQSDAFGGLKPALRRKIRRKVSSTCGGEAPSNRAGPTTSLRPSSRLVRAWHGRTYTVDVLEQGFVCGGRHYASLSQVARAITGARWSGPRFFGL